MIRLCLCDDDPKSLEACRTKVEDLIAANHIDLEMHEYSSGEALLFAQDNNVNHFNIIILDMLMNALNGIDTAKALRGRGYRGLIVFLTSSKEYALESFEVEPFNYILKNNLLDGHFDEVFLSAVTSIETGDCKKLSIISKRASIVLPLSEIMYIESSRRKIIFYTTRGTQETNYTLDEVFQKIKDQGFLRCHKSFVVNRNFVQTFSRSELVLKNGSIVPLGRSYAAEVEKLFTDYLYDGIVL